MNRKWIKIDEETYQSTENPDITVQVNREEDWREETELEEEDYEMYLVFPAHKGSGIPNTPSVFSELDYGSIDEAYKYALRDAMKIMELPIKQIEKFKWSMIT